MRRSFRWIVGVVGACGLWIGSAHGQTATAVDVTYSPSGGVVTVPVGSTVAVSVLGQVIDPSGGDDGIFVFSQNFTATNVTPGTTPAFEVVSVTRPGADDADFGGSDGTTSTDSSGDLLISGIYGGYFDDTIGVGSAATLYTVTLQAVAAGSAEVTDGPGTAPGYFTNQNADGFMLYDGSTPPAVYPLGPTLVAVTPEPATLGLTAAGLCFAVRRRRSSADTGS